MQSKILTEGKVVGDKIKEFENDWTANKPVAGKRKLSGVIKPDFLLGSIKYQTALETLRIFEGRMARLKDEHDRVRKAKAALDLEQHAEEDRLQPIEEEMADLKGVWTELANTWAEIDALKETPWSAVVPRKVIELKKYLSLC